MLHPLGCQVEMQQRQPALPQLQDVQLSELSFCWRWRWWWWWWWWGARLQTFTEAILKSMLEVHQA
jgi:hypothetical protein